MKIISTAKELENEIFQLKKSDKNIGFIPTMGALHDGHVSLIDAAKKNAQIVIVSIFVNPTQFTNPEDFEKYPQTLDKDIKQLEKIGVDIVFTPNKQEIYAEGKFLWKDDIYLPPAFLQSEGATRPGHFEGVYQVLHRLFSLVQPDAVFFGQKDFQQTLLVHVLIHQEFNVRYERGLTNAGSTRPGEIELFRCPIFREKSGLAMSSRNQRFSEEEKAKAKIISQSLFAAQNFFLQGVRNAIVVEKTIRKILESEILVEKIHYIEFRNINTFQEVSVLDEKTIILISCQFAGVHLIDNIILKDYS